MKSSYQKLKDQIAKLEEDKMYMYRDIKAMIQDPDSGQTSQIKWSYTVMFDAERAMFWGDFSKVELRKGLREKSEEMKGVYDQMELSPEDISEIANPYMNKNHDDIHFSTMFGRMGQAMINFYKKKDGKR